MEDPIRIRCEGSGFAGHSLSDRSILCAMCGQEVEFYDAGYARDHDRNDILAMLARGDFS